MCNKWHSGSDETQSKATHWQYTQSQKQQKCDQGKRKDEKIRKVQKK